MGKKKKKKMQPPPLHPEAKVKKNTWKPAFSDIQLEVLENCFNYTEEDLNDGFYHLKKRSRKRRRKIIQQQNKRHRKKKKYKKFEDDKKAYHKQVREDAMDSIKRDVMKYMVRHPNWSDDPEKIKKYVRKRILAVDKIADDRTNRVYSNARKIQLIDISDTATKDHPVTIEQAFTMEHLTDAYKRVRRGKTMRRQVVWYHMNYFTNLYDLQQRVLNGTYKIGKLSQFKVYEPKEREVVANQFEDKIVQDVIAKYVLGPLFSGSMIYDNYASQPGKGSLLALNRLKRYMLIHAKSVDWKPEGWVLMGDMRKFFYTIDHAALFDLIKDLPVDERLHQMIADQINVCTSEINPYTDEDGKGLCIGFETSQWSAVYYLNKLDHYIKEELGIKCYGRYMDDFYIIHPDRKYLEECMEKIRVFARSELKMELNKKTFIHPFDQGVCFLGYHVYYNARTHEVYSVIRHKSINNMQQRLRRHMKELAFGKLDIETALVSLKSWYSYAVHGDCEKAQNAYKKALSILMNYGEESCIGAYADAIENWDNLDNEDFYRLIPNPDEVIRDADGFAVLMPYKQSKKEFTDELNQQILADNIDVYKTDLTTASGLEKRILSGRNLSDSFDQRLQLAVNIMDNVCQELFIDLNTPVT